MKRQGQYSDSSMDSYAAQMQLMSSQRGNNVSGINHFSGKSDSLPGYKENPYISSKADAQWLLEKERAKGANSLSSYDNYGDGGEASRSFYHGQRPDAKAGFNKKENKDPRAQSHEKDMDVGHRNNPSTQTVESLPYMKLTQEQQEDIENAKHRVNSGDNGTTNAIIDLGLLKLQLSRLKNRLTALKSRRHGVLQREARQSQYPQARMSHYQNIAGPSDPRGYCGVASAKTVTDEHILIAAAAVNARGQLDLEKERELAEYRERVQIKQSLSRQY